MARERYQYGTSPRKIEPDYRRRKNNNRANIRLVQEKKRQQIKVSKEQRKHQMKISAVVAIVFLLLVAISCRNSQIDGKFKKMQEQKKQLATIQKENEQLKVNIENSLNLNNVEKVARDELGMVKLTSKQTVYIALPKKDYVESESEKVIIEEEKSWIEKILEKFWGE